VTARAAAEILSVNRNNTILFYHKLREAIFEALDAETPELKAGEIEIYESYFGGHRKGKRVRGAAWSSQIPVLARYSDHPREDQALLHRLAAGRDKADWQSLIVLAGPHFARKAAA
jgi:transposase-like protein